MKLKKILSALTAAAMAASVMAVTPVSVGAAALDKPEGTETVLATLDLGSTDALAQYGSVWVQNYSLEESWFTDGETYLKATFHYENAPVWNESDTMDVVATWGWDNYSGWLNAGKFYDGTVLAETSFVPATSSTNNDFYCYLPLSDFTPGTSIYGNVQNYLSEPATITVEVVNVSAAEVPYEGSVMSLTKNVWNEAAGDDGWNWQGAQTVEQTQFTKGMGMDKVFDKASTVKVSFKVNGATAGTNLEYDPSQISWQMNIKINNTKGATTAEQWPWIVGGSSSYENDVVTISADLASVLGEKYNTADCVFDSINIIPAAANTSADDTIKVYYEDMEVSLVKTVPATAVTIAPTSLELVVGDTAEVTAEVAPADTTDEIVYSSSDTSVVTVGAASGAVTAIAAGTATITAKAGEQTASCEVTVKSVISPVLSFDADTIKIYTEDTDEAKIAAAKAKVLLTGTGVNELEDDDYVIEATIKDNVVTLVFRLKNTDDFAFDSSFTSATATVTVTYSDWQPVVYNGYEIKGDLAIDVKADAKWTEVENIIGAMTIALSVSDEYADYNDGEVTSELLKNCAVIEKATLTPGAVVKVNATINLGDVMNSGDKYIDASDITLGASGTEKTELTVTFTVTVAEEEVVPDDDVIEDEEVVPDDDVIEDEEEVLPDDDDKTDSDEGIIPDDDVIEDDVIEDDEEEVLPEEPKPSIPVITLPAKGADGPTSSVWAGQVNNAVGAGRATSSIMTAKSGATLNVVVENSDYVISKKLLEKLAKKKDVTVNFLYTGCTITINSDDINANNVTSIDPYKSVRFLTRAEAKMFADAKDYRQFRFTSADLKGIEKFTLTVKMKGSAKNADADLLKRNAANDFEPIAEAKVGADRAVSFEITEPANYVVVAGKYTLD